jgi:hypothetical protein
MPNEAEDRYFCSNLITLQLPALESAEREVVGNLEEISTSKACVNVEEPIGEGLPLRLVCSTGAKACEFPGQAVECRHDVHTGYYVSVRFDPGVRWSPEVYAPKHLVRAGALLPAGPEANCCDRGICPKEVISRLLEPEFPLTPRVRAVARAVAALCGELTKSDTANCFSSLFGAGSECRLFAEFEKAYVRERRRGPRSRKKDLCGRVEAMVQLANRGSGPLQSSIPNGR